VISGQSMKNPSVGREEHNPSPPPQVVKPVWMRLTPMSMTVGPVTMGGNIRFRTFGDRKEINISVRAHTAQVPIKAPYASGHGSLEPSGASEQKPLEYIWSNAPVAIGMIAKDVPTTEIRPVPM
jgi:hypothetical protein